LKEEIQKQLDDIEEDTQKPFGNLSFYHIIIYYHLLFLSLLLLDIF